MPEAGLLGETLPFRVLLDEAMVRTRRHFRSIYPTVALPVLVATTAVTVAQAKWMGGLSRLPTVPSLSAMLGSFAIFSLAVLLLVFVKMVAYGAMLVAAVDVLEARPLHMGGCWAFVARPRTLGTLILSALATAFAFLFCFFPAIFVALLFAFILPVMRDEGRFGVEAMRRSSHLARFNPRRHWSSSSMLKIFVVFVVGAIISYAVGLSVQLPFVVAQQIILFSRSASGLGADPGAVMESLLYLQVPGAVLGSLAEAAVTLYMSFGLALLYFDLRRRREGDDLDAAVAALEARLGLMAEPNAVTGPPRP